MCLMLDKVSWVDIIDDVDDDIDTTDDTDKILAILLNHRRPLILQESRTCKKQVWEQFICCWRGKDSNSRWLGLTGYKYLDE